MSEWIKKEEEENVRIESCRKMQGEEEEEEEHKKT